MSHTELDQTEKIDLFDQLASSTPDVIWMFTADWEQLLYINESYEEVWGRPIENLRATPGDFLEGVHPDDRETVQRQMERVSAGNPIDFEFRVNERADFGRWVWVRGQPIEDGSGEVIRVAGFVRDITERKAHRERLETQNTRLEEFTSVVSHDLRNPLTVAQGTLELAKEDHEREYLETIERSLDRMDSLIETLLEQTRSDGNELTMEHVAIPDIAQTCWQNVETADATLAVDTTLTVRGDRERLKQLFENIYRNSIEHGGADVTVWVADLPDERGFFVADDGEGLAPEADPNDLFEPGFSTTTGGTGLGLSIVADIVDEHDWSVDVAPSKEGMRFDITDVDIVE